MNERLRRGVAAMRTDEREAYAKAMQAALCLSDTEERRRLVSAVSALGKARGRGEMRAESDAVTDRRRRKLVGPRLPRQEAERCRECAAAQGISLYRFAAQALRRECDRVERSLNTETGRETETE